MYCLSLIAIFKNEAHILKEWIEHYINEGVSHFYLIDNGSEDDYQPIIQPYIDRGLISLVVDQTKYHQTEHYNKYFLKVIKSSSQWVMVVDLDEFIYSRLGHVRITDYLKSLNGSVGQIYVPWKEFGSSGLIKQPKSCVEGFLWRRQYTSPHSETHTKTIFNPRLIRSIWIHHSFLNKGTEITSDGASKSGSTPYFAEITESRLERSCLHCNHYYAQSFEWYRTVKITRGSASGQVNDQTKSLDNFNRWNSNSNQIQDHELVLKRNTHLDVVVKPKLDRLAVYYGCGSKYVEVTNLVNQHFRKGNVITIEPQTNLNVYLGDPLPYVKKYLVFCHGVVCMSTLKT
jgi:hypothetical protein